MPGSNQPESIVVWRKAACAAAAETIFAYSMPSSMCWKMRCPSAKTSGGYQMDCVNEFPSKSVHMRLAQTRTF